MGKIKSFATYETLLLAVTFTILVVALSIYNTLRYYGLGADSGGFVGLIGAVADSGTMVAPIFTSFYSAIPLLSAPPDVYCASLLRSLHQTTSFLQWHSYLIAYVLALPVKYFGVTSLEISAFVNAINISGSLALIYWFLRRQGVAVLECLGFILIVAVSQYWVGTLAGQFYFDRLFILPGMVLVLFCYRRCDRNDKVWLPVCLIAALTAVSISERTALLTGVLTFGYWLLSMENRFKGRALAMLLFSVSSLIYVFIYMKVFQNSAYYSGLNWSAVLNNLRLALTPGEPLFTPTMTWMGIVSPMVILAFINWRHGVLVLAALAPNLLVSVGGAEKTGFFTHYHAGYIPFLVGFAAIGYATLINNLKLRSLSKASWIQKSLRSALTLAVILIAIAASKADEARPTYLTIARSALGSEAISKKKKDMTEFLSAISPDQFISSPEWTMPTLAALGIGKVDYMPIGIGANRYVIAHYVPPSTLPEIPSYLDASSKEKISACIQGKLTIHYRAKSEMMSDGSRYVIYEKQR